MVSGAGKGTLLESFGKAPATVLLLPTSTVIDDADITHSTAAVASENELKGLLITWQ